MTANDIRTLKIAVASSGLGHVRRGVESWADDLGKALRLRGLDVTTYQGGGEAPTSSHCVVPCFRRFESPAQHTARFFRRFGGWRYGLGSGYDVEQSTFALNLWRKIGRTHDILHVQDPQVAITFEWLSRMGFSRPRVILGHGTEEDASVLKRISYLQHLAPNYMEDWKASKPGGQLNFAIPNFIDTERFSPADKQVARAAAGLPQDALIFIAVCALKRTHKRVDYLMREFTAWRKTYSADALLLVAGAREAETDEILRLKSELDPKSILVTESLGRDKIINLLRAADVFTLASLHEMMPIAVLEALACGLPVACNDTATLRWIVGDAGDLTDISQPGRLAEQFAMLARPDVRARRAQAARPRAEALFSEEVVVNQVVEMYDMVASNK